MKRHFALLLALVLSGPACLWGAQEATFRLHCLSLRFPPVSAGSLGVSYTLALGTAAGQGADGNGELAPLFDPTAPTTHGCRFSLQSEIFPEPMPGYFFLNVPPVVDANHDGVNDFFEVGMPVETATTRGAFIDDLTEEDGTMSAIWSRDAGSAQGTCQLRLTSSYVQLTFNATFTLWEYDGRLAYAPASGSVTGLVNLADAAPASNTLAGPIALNVVNKDNLTWTAGAWTNGAGQAWSFQATAAGETAARTGTNYLGFLDATDGDPATGGAGFGTWILVIGDPNDANQNGIPDLTDPPPVPVRAPVLSLTRNGGALWLSLQGDPGQSYRVEQNSALGTTNWTTVGSLVLTNDPALFALDPPTNRAVFYRVRAP